MPTARAASPAPPRRPPTGRARGTAPSAGANTAGRRRAARRAVSTTPFMSKKSTARRGAAPVVGRGRARPGERQRAPLRRRVREARADLEQPHVVAARGGGCARTASTRPGSSDGRSTANFSDSGLAIGDGVGGRRRTARAASRSMNANVTPRRSRRRSATRRTSRSRAMRGSGGAGACASAGNVAGSRSKP